MSNAFIFVFCFRNPYHILSNQETLNIWNADIEDNDSLQSWNDRSEVEKEVGLEHTLNHFAMREQILNNSRNDSVQASVDP